MADTHFINLYPITLQYLTFSIKKKRKKKEALLEVNTIYSADLRAGIFKKGPREQATMLKLSDRGKWILKRRQRSTKTNFMYVCIYTYMLHLYHTGVTFLVFRDGFFGNVFPTTLSMK